MKHIQISQIVVTLILVGLNIASNLAANWIANSSRLVLLTFMSAAVIAGVVYFFTRPRTAQARLEPPIALRTDQEKKEHAHRGLILTIGLFNPLPKSSAFHLTIDERRAAAERLDYQVLDFKNSNFAPLISAIEGHSSRLECVWLLNTQSEDQTIPGSNTYLPVLEKYLQDEIKVTCKTNPLCNCTIPLEDDDAITVKSRELVNNIYNHLKDLNLREEDIIADITGGTTPIKLGIILASLDQKRKVQFMGTHYGSDGRPVGNLFPILFNFSPEILD